MHIYIHIPFCRRKCRYCAFYSVPSRVNDEYIPALVNEIRFYSQIYDIFSGDYDTLYIGGGTPSLLSADQISEIISSVKRYFRLSPAEFTVEVNPESFTRDFADAILSLGANRVSIGVQSFFDDDLRFLGRIHSAEQSRRAIEIA
ncbi:MAG TPA: radical SAM protein, partial [candidate division Zixibacteria bacterium]|nr:radical SAM protein [candidate division Zixibacteria bacterium]